MTRKTRKERIQLGGLSPMMMKINSGAKARKSTISINQLVLK
jgi:hypothetical protein